MFSFGFLAAVATIIFMATAFTVMIIIRKLVFHFVLMQSGGRSLFFNMRWTRYAARFLKL